MTMTSSPEAHSTAIIDPTARLAAGCRVGPYAVIEAAVELGPNCRVEAHAVIKRFTRLGADNHVFEGAVLGGTPQDLKFKHVASGLRVGDRNVFREHVTVNRSTTEGKETRIGDDNFLMTQAHVAHECVLGNRIVMANNVSLAGHVTLEDSAFISGGVVIHQFCRIGRLCMIGGNAKVVQDVPPFCLADGVPARLRSLNLVGLQRAGLSRQEVSALKKAFQILGRTGEKLTRRLEQLEALGSPSVAYLAAFIRTSERGCCRIG